MDRSTAFSLVDADVHNYPNVLTDLKPFLSARWQAYAKQPGLQLPGVLIPSYLPPLRGAMLGRVLV